MSYFQAYSGLADVAMMSQDKLPVQMKAFYGSEIFSDKKLLARSMGSLGKGSSTVTFFNTIALHDGNRKLNGDGVISYHDAAKKLLDTVHNLFDRLNASGRKTMIVFLGAHGRNYAGDAIQMSGLRDIPSPDFTQVPVAIKFTGLSASEERMLITTHIKQPSSFYGLSEFIAGVMKADIFNGGFEQKLPLIVKQISSTPMVSESQGASVVRYADKPYIKLRNEFDWMVLSTATP